MPEGPADRSARVRAAIVELVAELGFHGASMAKVAQRAGVATGTAYTYYASKDDLIIDAYREVKRTAGAAAVRAADPAAPAAERFSAIWRGLHDHLAADRSRARFLVQVEHSPLAERAHARAIAEGDDPLMLAAMAPDMAALLLPLPLSVLYDLGLGPAVRLAAAELAEQADTPLDLVAAACWRAIVAG